MGRPSRGPVGLRIVLREQQSLVRPHVRRVVPLVLFRICSDLPPFSARFRSERVASIGLGECLGNICVQGNQVTLIHRSSVTDGEGVTGHDIQGSPEIDDRPVNLFELLRVGFCIFFQFAISD